MGREDGPGLLYRHPVPLLLLGARLHPLLHLSRITRVSRIPPTDVIEDSPQHPHVTVNRSRGEMTRAAAVKATPQTEVGAREVVHLSPARTITKTQEACDILGGSQQQRRSRRPLGAGNSPDAKKVLKVLAQTILLTRILRLAHKLAELSPTAAKGRVLEKGG